MKDVELYIAGRRVDVADDGLVIFNWSVTELENPTVVKNSYTHEVTLPGTATNNAVFEHAFRCDSSFNPLVRVPFLLLAGGELVQSGYCKLGTVETKGAEVTYGVTLYGGLGDLLYSLQTDEAGESLTLADLDWTNGGGEDELSFVVGRSVVADAWANIGTGKWGCVNFAPCINGIPDKNFDAAKVARKDEDTAQWVIDELESEQDEWQRKELRSYLQRPCFSIRAFFEALQRRAVALGKSLILDDGFFHVANPYYAEAWCTLPLLTDSEKWKGSKVAGVMEGGSVSGIGADANFTCGVTWDAPLTVDTTTTVRCRVQFAFTPQLTLPESVTEVLMRDEDTASGVFVCIDSVKDGRYVAKGTSLLCWNDPNKSVHTPQEIAAACGLHYAVDGYNVSEHQFGRVLRVDGTNAFAPARDEVALEVTGADLESVHISIYGFHFVRAHYDEQGMFVPATGGLYAWYKEAGLPLAEWKAMTPSAETAGGTGAAQLPDNISSGAKIDKALLFGADKTPLDYLLSYCKMFGLMLTCSDDGITTTIRQRDDFYRNEVTDISEMIDRGQVVSDKMYISDKRRLRFALEAVGGKAEGYEKMWGKTYGEAVANTGNTFSTETEDVLGKVAFRGGVQVWREGLPFDMLQCAGDDGKGTDGDGVLLFANGTAAVSGYYLSDDFAKMHELCDGKACWVTVGGDYTQSVARLPMFGRWQKDGSRIVRQMDLGTPLEIYDNRVSGIDENSDIVSQYWLRYLGDRYGRQARVLTCKVRFERVSVGQDLLRRFWWFDGAVWALNAIRDYGVMTDEPCECEFVRVASVANYVYMPMPLQLSSEGVTLLVAGSGAAVDVVSGNPWTVASAPGWVTVSPDEGGVRKVQTVQTVAVSAEAWTGDEPRSGNVVFVCGEQSVTLAVRQLAEVVPSGVPHIVAADCIHCGYCANVCPAGAVVDKGDVFEIVADACVECGECVNVCPVGAVVAGNNE